MLKKPMKLRLLILLLIICPKAETSQNDYIIKDNYKFSQNTWGGIGLIQNPTARFSKDGEFTFGISSESPYNRMYSTIQFFPWMEAGLRYTEATYTPYNFGNSQTWKDKGFDLKLKLLDEQDHLPALAIGALDLGGTGFYSSEYIVMSKMLRNVDLTLGLGWGRFANAGSCWLIDYDPTLCPDKRGHMSNPFGWFFDSYNERGRGSRGGGSLNLRSLFTGPEASFFGGIEYFTPIDNLSLKIEYDSHDYREVIGRETVIYEDGDIFKKPKSPFNIAVHYAFRPSEREKLDLNLGLVRGDTIYASFAVHSNLNDSGKEKYTAPPEVINKKTIKEFSFLKDNYKNYLSELIFWQMGNEGMVAHSVTFDEEEMIVEISQGRFRQTIKAIDLAGRILANNSPKNIEKITVVNLDQGIETLRSSVSRENLVRSVLKGPIDDNLLTFNDGSQVSESAEIMENKTLYPNFSWSLRPHLNGTLQHQIRFYFYQLEALLSLDYAVKKGLYLNALIGIDINNNFDKYTWHIPDGELHPVRQDRRLYLTEGTSGVRRMAFDYLFAVNSNIKGRVTGGLLEWMYGGLGGEILYVPDHKKWAIGIDAYWVKQREFDQKFSFRDYQTTTGFLTYYRDLPFYDMRLKLSAGKFLGKDNGLLVDVSRRFDTGARIGAKVALTDCDASCVGEGRFSKWIYFNLPMDLFYVNSTTRSVGPYEWSPLTKDAGQKVAAGSLYNLVVSAQDEVDTLRLKPWSIKKIFSGFSRSPRRE
tara:strand:- start:71885 stop:74152 length:2268 start_codon:yes stop_codon:yes gene_type:complete